MKSLKNVMKAAVLGSAVMALLFTGCSKSSNTKGPGIAVFVPGIMADSPIYANLAAGVTEAVAEYNATKEPGTQAKLYVMEAGPNQSEWATKLTALTATGEYDVIISSNPSLPEYAAPLTEKFPNQKYIFLDAACEGNANIAAISYNQKEQSFLSGYIAGLMSKSHKVGLIAAQEYPVMNKVLHPYYALGAETAVPGTSCDFRIVGNWYDGAKGAEIADAMIASGVDVILPICGGASRGVISSATEKKIYLNWFDDNGFNKAPGVVISSCMTMQEKAAKEITASFLKGETAWGTTKTVGLTEGYIEFLQQDALYIETVPADVRQQLSDLIDSLVSETYKVPELN